MRFLLGCISFAVSLHAASFVQVQCGSPLGTPIRYNETDSSSSCSSLSYNPSDIPRGSFASGSVTLQMATDSSQYSTLKTSQSAGATIATPPGAVFGIGTGSSITIGYETQIHTLGAER